MTPRPDPELVAALTGTLVGALDPRVEWGLTLRVDGDPALDHRADDVAPTASVGKVILLVALAEALAGGDVAPGERLTPTSEDLVADSGLWQHLPEPSLSVESAAALVGAVSDNLATNVLLRRIGLPAVAAAADRLGLRATALHDQVRDERHPLEHAPTLSTGTPRELAALMGDLRAGTGMAPDVAERVVGWLRLGTDLSMTLAPLGLDPLAHVDADRGVRVFHKTGTDDGIRVDCGSVAGPAGVVDYCVAASWDAERADLRSAALAGHHQVGRVIRTIVGAP